MKNTVIIGCTAVAVGFGIWFIARKKDKLLNPFDDINIDWMRGDLHGVGVVNDD